MGCIDVLPVVPLWKTSRYMIVFVHFFVFLVLYGQRVNLSFAIVCMVNHTTVNDEKESPTDSECGEADSTPSTGGKFEWDKDTQGLVLASFFYGYILTQLPGGWLQRKYGAKVTLGTSMMLGSLVSILSPASAKVHPYMLASLRIFHGILQGVVFPCYYGLLGVWAPPNERSRMLSYAGAGMHMGNILTLALSGVICSTIGWEWTFHFFGVLGFAVTICFFYTVYDSPLEHPKIRAAEKKLILHSLEGEVHKIEKKHHDVPWMKILSSTMPWILSLTMFCSSWGFYTLLTNLPTFMYEVLKFDLQKNGLVSALPYFAVWVTLFLASTLADFLISKRHMKKIWVRRIWNTTGMVGPGVFLVVASQVDCSSAPLAVLFMIIGQSLSAFYPSGCSSSHLDVLPRYCGVIYALSNTFSCIPGMVAPLVIAKITANKTQEEWQIVFYITLALQVFGATIYFLFIRAEVLPWAQVSQKEDVMDIIEEVAHHPEEMKDLADVMPPVANRNHIVQVLEEVVGELEKTGGSTISVDSITSRLSLIDNVDSSYQNKIFDNI